MDFLGYQWPYHKLDSFQHAFLEDLVSYVAKGYEPLFLLKIHGCSVWFCGSVGMYSFHLITKW
jgi:hypothetical protein